MAAKSPARRGRPPKGQESKMSAVLSFAQNPPKNWEQLSSQERKARVCRTIGINQPYLQQLIAKNEDLKDFFGIIRRRRRGKAAVGLTELTRQAKGLPLDDLISLSRNLRQEIKRRIDLAQAEINAK